MVDGEARAALVRRLDGRTRGRVRTDLVARTLYATDASPYRILPAAVLIAEEADDVHAAIAACREVGVPITARGAGTSLSGQCVGAGLQLDTSRLDAVEWVDAERHLARVAPGATWWTLNAQAGRHGLEFGPDPATKRQCTIGGMVGTNAGGTHSIVYGATVDHVHAVEGVLADGRRIRLEASPDGTVAGGGAPTDLAGAVERVRAEAGPLLGDSFRTLARRGAGYQLEHLCTGRPHLAKLLAGSEGTLALTTAVEVSLDVRPASRVLALVGFDDLHAAIAAVPHLVDTGPCAVEVLDRALVDMARRDPLHAPSVRAVDPSLGALLFVEYQGDSPGEAASGFERMDRALDAAGGARVRHRVTEPAACAATWRIREAGIGSLSAVSAGPLLPQALVEDSVVAVDRLPGYIREFDRLFSRHGLEVVWYGHASTGLVHVRPFLDMTKAEDVARIEPLLADVTDLVRDWHGDHSGEHGDGMLRSALNERLFGPELYAQLRALKGAFDPDNLLNPGKVVDGPPPVEHLRYGPTYRRVEVASPVSFADQGGYAAATERCFGAGVCRKRGVGSMCPPAAATGLEEHSTRARANLLHAAASGRLDPRELEGPEAHEVMDTCVACKACKTECPARVDMARLKAGWMDGVRRAHGPMLLQRAVARLRLLSALAAPVAPLANVVLRPKAVRRRLGVAAERRVPKVAYRTLTTRLDIGSGDVLLYPDCFTVYQEPDIGSAAARLYAAAGHALGLARVGCCGRIMLSEGYVDRARTAARRAVARLRRTSGPIVFCEPSCLSMVTDDWPHLVGDVSDVAERCVLAEEHLAELSGDLRFRSGGRVLLHGHCHQKALWGTGGTERALALVDGLEMEVLDAGCCGMAGAFGYRADRYELSVAMAERALLPAIRAAPEAELVATGTSCRHQITDLTGREAVHPLVFLLQRMR